MSLNTIYESGTHKMQTSGVPGEPVSNRHITKRAFYNRLGDDEIVIDLASQGDTVQAATLRKFMRRVDNSPWVDLDLDETVQGLNYIEQNIAGVSTGFADRVLNADIEKWERP